MQTWDRGEFMQEGRGSNDQKDPSTSWHPQALPLIRQDRFSSQVPFRMPVLEALVHGIISFQLIIFLTQHQQVWLRCYVWPDFSWNFQVAETQFKLLRQEKSILTQTWKCVCHDWVQRFNNVVRNLALLLLDLLSSWLHSQAGSSSMVVRWPPAPPAPLCQVRSHRRREHTSFPRASTKVKAVCLSWPNPEPYKEPGSWSALPISLRLPVMNGKCTKNNHGMDTQAKKKKKNQYMPSTGTDDLRIQLN